MRHHGVRNSSLTTHTLRDDGHQHCVIRVNRRDIVFADDSAHDGKIFIDVKLEIIVAELDHRYDPRIFLVFVPHEYGKGLANPRLMQNASSRKWNVTLQ